MTYFMTFGPDFKAIRPTDGTRLAMPTSGGELEVHLYKKTFFHGAGPLVAVPQTARNLVVLGLENVDVVESDWIVPPFILDRSGFVAGGPFRRAGKISIPFDPEKIAVLGGEVVYQPRIARFVPDFEDLNSGGVSEINGGYDTSSWSIKMWVGGLGVRPASSEERQFPHVPWETFSLALLDLWLEQFRCCQLGESIPFEISKPEGEITF